MKGFKIVYHCLTNKNSEPVKRSSYVSNKKMTNQLVNDFNNQNSLMVNNKNELSYSYYFTPLDRIENGFSEEKEIPVLAGLFYSEDKKIKHVLNYRRD